MNTNFLRSMALWALVSGCVLLGPAWSQEARSPAASDQSGVQAAAADSSPEDRAGTASGDQAPAEKPADGNQWSGSETAGEGSDDASADEQAPRHLHKHHVGKSAIVSIGHKAELPAGTRADSVVALFGSATAAGDVDNDVVSILGSTRVTGRVGQGAVAVMGNVYVNSEVHGDVVAVLGNVELGPEARVRGNVVVVGGELTQDPAAVVDGDVQRVLATDWTDFEWVRPWIDRCLLYGRPLAFEHGLGWAWGIALGALALYLFIAFLFHGAVERCVRTLETSPGQSVLAAVLTVLLTPVVFLLLILTVLGIVAVPFLALGVLCADMFGKVVVLTAIGKRCTPMLADQPRAHTIVGLLVGSAIALFLYTIPVMGFVTFKLLEFLGLGVVVYTLIQLIQLRRQSPPPAAGAGVSSPGVAAPGVAAPHASAAPNRAFTAADPGASAPPPGDVSANGTPAGGAAPAGMPGGGAATGGMPGGGAATGGMSGGGAAAAGMSGGAAPTGDAMAGRATEPSAPAAPALSNPRAGFMIRMAALLLDALLVGIVVHQFHDGANLELLLLATYGAVMWKLKGTTVGGIICSLQVVRLDGRPLDWPTAIVRALSCFLSLAVAGLGFLWIAIDSENQSWHDKIAGTAVVRLPKGPSLL